MPTLRGGDNGVEVEALQNALAARGYNPGPIDGDFGAKTTAAVIAFQKVEGLDADGIAGKNTLKALELGKTSAPAVPLPVEGVTVEIVTRLFPGARTTNIQTHLPNVLQGLVDVQLDNKPMVLMALGTIRAETAEFVPISEFKSRFNTAPDGEPFALYDDRTDIGNSQPGDGAKFKGRGFIQLTGKANYKKIGAQIGLGDGLVNDPELANDSKIAARILAAFLKDKETRILQALTDKNLRKARRLVNGGSHGLDEFSETYNKGDQLIA